MTSERAGAQPAEGRERNWGLDLLRMVTMYFIIILHLLGQGGVLGGTAPFSWGFLGAWGLEAAALCAVNCYGLISGYVGYESSFRYRKYLPHWLQVAFWSVGLYLLYWVLRPGGGDLRGLLRSFLPVLTGEYWYFTAYTALFFLMPFLNIILRQVTEKEARTLCLTLILLFSLLPSLLDKDPFILKFGYSPLWLISLYLIGGCLKRFSCRRLLGTLGSLGVYALCVLLSWGGMLLYTRRVFTATGAMPPADPFLRYTAPLMLLAALALFHGFRQLRLKNRGLLALIRFFAPVSFGVYLIHTHPVVWNHVLAGLFVPLLALPAPAYLALVPATALGVFLACSCLDYARLRLFGLLGALTHRKES